MNRAARDATLDRLIGAWDLVSWSETRSDGSIDYPLGENVVGKIIYAAQGHMSAQLARSNPERLSDDDWKKATEAESAAAWKSYFGYFGTWSLDPEQQAITHHIEGAWFPNLAGTKLVRRYRFEGLRLILDGDTARGRAQIVWQRAAEKI